MNSQCYDIHIYDQFCPLAVCGVDFTLVFLFIDICVVFDAKCYNKKKILIIIVGIFGFITIYYSNDVN